MNGEAIKEGLVDGGRGRCCGCHTCLLAGCVIAERIWTSHEVTYAAGTAAIVVMKLISSRRSVKNLSENQRCLFQAKELSI